MEKYANLFLFGLVILAVIVTMIVTIGIRRKRARLSAELNEVENILEPMDDAIEHSLETKPNRRNQVQEKANNSEALSELGFDEISSMFSEKDDDDAYLSVQEESVHDDEEDADYQDNFIILNVMSHPGQAFMGYDLLQALLAAGFRFGEMSIFHRYQDANQGGNIIFSLASATEPGIFDMNKMGLYTCKGLTIFMQLKDEYHDADAFELMLMTAQQLTEDLDGILQDNKHQELTENTVNHYLNKIKHFQKRLQLIG